MIGREFNPETQRREPFLIAATRDLDQDFVYAKERRLVEEIKSSLERGRKVQVYAVYTQKRDVTRRLEKILVEEGIRVEVLTTEVSPELREAWYERQLRAGVQVVISHPRLVQTGLDYVEYGRREQGLPGQDGPLGARAVRCRRRPGETARVHRDAGAGRALVRQYHGHGAAGCADLHDRHGAA